MVLMVIEVEVIERHPEGVGIQQGSPVSPILVAIYTSGLPKCVHERISGVDGQSFMVNIR